MDTARQDSKQLQNNEHNDGCLFIKDVGFKMEEFHLAYNINARRPKALG